jgi:hypothetical protein
MRNIELGQTEIQVGTTSLKIFDRERTVVDSFRYLTQEACRYPQFLTIAIPANMS